MKICDLQTHGLKFIQEDGLFPFGSDGVELANFVRGGKRDRAIDLCCGTGIVPILLAGKKGIPTTGVELQENAAEVARRNAELNGLDVTILRMRAQNAPQCFAKGVFNIVTCNPPYRKAGAGPRSASAGIDIARGEVEITAEETVAVAAALLGDGGRFYVIHRCERMDEIMYLCRSRGLIPKELQVLRTGEEKPPRLFMLMCRMNAGDGLKVLPERMIYGTTADDYPGMKRGE